MERGKWKRIEVMRLCKNAGTEMGEKNGIYGQKTPILGEINYVN